MEKSIRRKRAVLLSVVTRTGEQNEFTLMRSNKPHSKINKVRRYGGDFALSAESKGKLVYKSFSSQAGSRISPFEEL